MPLSSSPTREVRPSRCAELRQLGCAVILAALGAFVELPAATVPASTPSSRPRDPDQPVIFGTPETFFPYSYRDRNGELKGFANDITDAVARASRLPLKRVTVAIHEVPAMLRSGQIDVIQFWSETPERQRWADFSVPILRLETVVIVRREDSRIRRLADLQGKRVAVGQEEGVADRYLRNEQPEAIPVYGGTGDEVLRMLADGRVDAVVKSRLTAVSLIEHAGLKNLTVLGERIPGDAYDVRYCFGVRDGDAMLLARLNEGLAIIHRTGEFDEIYHRWFGRYDRRTFTALEVVSYVAAALALACGAVTWGLLRQRTLRRHVARQAAELSAQRSLLAALYDRHPIATAILEVAGDGAVWLVSLNPQGMRLFAADPSQVFPRPLGDAALSPDATKFLRDAVNRWQKTAEPSQWEAPIEGGQRLLETALVPLGAGERGGTRICVLSNDVTKRRLVDNELAQSRRLRALGELVGGIAHEFNNLLTPIIMTTSQARAQRTLPAAVQADFTVIDHAARRAAELTKRLLTFGRSHAEQPQAVLLRDAVENCFALLRSTVDRRVQWTLRGGEGLPPLVVNPTDLNQIVFNLVINARDTLLEKLAQPHEPTWIPELGVVIEEIPVDAFTPASRGARVRTAGAPLAWQRFVVVDNGLGIPPEITERIFEPFFTTKQIGQGTGLGLATVWHLVNEAGGDISVQSELGKGTRFGVTLPRLPRPPDRVAAPGGAAGQAVTPRGLRILLVEDDPLVARATLAVLERARHVVTHCADGSEAWARLADGGAAYDILLLDLNMPRLNGADLIRRIRQGVFRGAIAVMSGRITDDERRLLEELRVDKVIHKPFSASDLTEAVRELAPRRPGRSPPA